jgi:hypothetical protein
MVSAPLTVRALVTASERERHCQFADQAFSHAPSPESARHWQQFVTTMPGYRPEQLRGAFRDGEQVGSLSASWADRARQSFCDTETEDTAP